MSKRVTPHKTTISARLGELEWHLSEYDDKQKSRVLSCSAGDMTAFILQLRSSYF